MSDPEYWGLHSELTTRIVAFVREREQFAIENGRSQQDARATETTVYRGILQSVRARLSVVYQCEQCGRVWLDNPDDGQTMQSFAPEHAWTGKFNFGETLVAREDVDLRGGPSHEANVVCRVPAATELSRSGPARTVGGVDWVPVTDSITGATGFVPVNLTEAKS